MINIYAIVKTKVADEKARACLDVHRFTTSGLEHLHNEGVVSIPAKVALVLCFFAAKSELW